MDYVEVKALLDAGFTADEIRGMMGNVQTNNPQIPQISPQDPGPAEPEQDNKDTADNHPVSDPPLSATAVPIPGMQADQDDSRFTALNNSIQQLIKTIQTSNLRSDSFSTPVAKDLDSQVDSIMGSIIRPERKEGGSAQ